MEQNAKARLICFIKISVWQSVRKNMHLLGWLNVLGFGSCTKLWSTSGRRRIRRGLKNNSVIKRIFIKSNLFLTTARCCFKEHVGLVEATVRLAGVLEVLPCPLVRDFLPVDRRAGANRDSGRVRVAQSRSQNRAVADGILRSRSAIAV